MKKIVILLLIAMTVASCQKDRTTDCELRACPYVLRYVVINFVDKNGAPTEVKNYSVVNQRTGEEMPADKNYLVNGVPGSFIVVQNTHAPKLSEAGDDLKITGTSVVTNQTKTAIIKVSGGKCACDVNKISGPERIAFD